MLNIIHEAGWGAWVVILCFAIGAVRLISRRGGAEAGQGAAIWATLAIALSITNASAGQEKVDEAVRAETDPLRSVAILSEGTREASRNFMVGGTCAALLLLLGGIRRGRKTRAGAESGATAF